MFHSVLCNSQQLCCEVLSDLWCFFDIMLVAADMQRRLKAAQGKIEELETELQRANKEITDLQKQLKLLQDQRDKLLALQVAVVMV